MEYSKSINPANTNGAISFLEESYYIRVPNIILQEENWAQKVENYFLHCCHVYSRKKLFSTWAAGPLCSETSFQKFVINWKTVKLLNKCNSSPLSSPPWGRSADLETTPAGLHPNKVQMKSLKGSVPHLNSLSWLKGINGQNEHILMMV